MLSTTDSSSLNDGAMTETGGTRLSPRSYGKTGGAGTFMWVDPRQRLVAILLTNHGLPVPFDGAGWARMIDDIGVGEFYDGVVNAIRE